MWNLLSSLLLSQSYSLVLHYVWLLHFHVTKSVYYPWGTICLHCACLKYHHGTWHTRPLNALMTHFNSLMNRAVLPFLDTPGFRAWIKQAPAQRALKRSAVNRNWCWFGSVGEDCNKARVLLQKVSLWSMFGKSVFSLVMQCEDTVPIAHFGWVRIWPSCLWAAAELAPESVIIHFWSVIGIPFSDSFLAHCQ